MKQAQSAIYKCDSRPHLVVGNLKEAKEKCIELEKKAMTNQYWYEPVKNTL